MNKTKSKEDSSWIKGIDKSDLKTKFWIEIKWQGKEDEKIYFKNRELKEKEFKRLRIKLTKTSGC